MTGYSEYDGWTIKRNETEDSFGDLSGYDVRASISRFCEMLESRLQERFPGADIEIEYNPRNPDGRLYVFAPPAEAEREDDVRNKVEAIIADLFEGGEWAVPAQEA